MLGQGDGVEAMEVKAESSISGDYSRSDLPDLLHIYYKRLFPYGPFYRWLSYGNGKSNHSMGTIVHF